MLQGHKNIMKCLMNTSEAMNTQSRYTERNMLHVKKYRKVYSSHTCSPEEISNQ